jgi:hypothetical protein
VYNAGTGADLRNVDQGSYCLLPSPSSSGAFVVEHFDRLVGYLVNSQFTLAWRRASSKALPSPSAPR